MPLPGKKKYTIYLTIKDAETIQGFIKRTRYAGGLSAILDDYVGRLAHVLRKSGLDRDDLPLSTAKVIRLMWEGSKEAFKDEQQRGERGPSGVDAACCES